jgi:uncharacterized membrane protein YkvA (DUF1232 family)
MPRRGRTPTALIGRAAGTACGAISGSRRSGWRRGCRSPDLLAAYYCAFDRATPLRVRIALLAALAYFVLPFDFIPDVLPLVGFTDDAAVLFTAIRLVSGHMREEHRLAAREALARVREGRL